MGLMANLCPYNNILILTIFISIFNSLSFLLHHLLRFLECLDFKLIYIYIIVYQTRNKKKKKIIIIIIIIIITGEVAAKNVTLGLNY